MYGVDHPEVRVCVCVCVVCGSACVCSMFTSRPVNPPPSKDLPLPKENIYDAQRKKKISAINSHRTTLSHASSFASPKINRAAA